MLTPLRTRPLMRGGFLSGPGLGQTPGPPVRCCPNPNAPPGQEMPCYDAQGNLVYYADATKHSFGQCNVPTQPPPPAGAAPGAPPVSLPAQLPNVITQSPPSPTTFPIANMTFPGGMEEPPLEKFTHLQPAPQPAQMLAPVGPTTVYPPSAPKLVAFMTPASARPMSYPVQVLPQPSGTAVPLSDYFKRG